MSTIAYPPGTPPLDKGPVETPLDIEDSQLTFKQSRAWLKFFQLLYAAILALQARPVLLSGLFANRPAATTLPENTRYFATNTLVDYINIYGTPGDPTTAAWVVVP